MKKYMGVYVKIIACILITVTFSGCWSAKELNTIGIVMGIGIDKSKENNQINITTQIFKPSGVKTSSKGGPSSSSNNTYLNLYNNGTTIADTLSSFNQISSRKLFFSDNNVIIFGKSAAEDVEKYIDFFIRNRETRLLVSLLVSEGTASEVLNTKTSIEDIGAKNIGELVQHQDDSSKAINVNLKKFLERLMSKTTAPIIPIVKVSNDQNNNIPFISETAVFNKTKMIGILNEIETRGLSWAINEVKGGTIVVTMPEKNDNITIEISRVKSKITPKIINDKLSIEINIKEEGDLADQSSSEDNANPETFGKIEKVQGELIKKEVLLALKKGRELNADIFGFGDVIYERYPNKWDSIAKNWDEIYKSINVDVNVEAKLLRTGRITKPATVKE